MDSAFCCAVNRHLDVLGFIIDGQSDGHGVTLNDLFIQPWKDHICEE
jgi:hypothetical protein